MLSDLSSGGIIALFACLVIAMTAHEAMHAFTARWLGDTTAEDSGRLTLNPLRHIDLLTTVVLPIISYKLLGVLFLAAKPVPFNPNRVKYGEFGAALVGLAGPLTNLVLAFVVSLLIRANFVTVDSSIFSVVSLFMKINVALFVFNMIPFPPLDGSRLLYAVAPEPVQEVMARIEASGFMAIAIFMLIFFWFLSPIVVNVDNSIISFLLT